MNKLSFLGTEDQYGIRPIDRFHNHGALLGGVGGWTGGAILGHQLAHKARLGFGGELASMGAGAVLGGAAGGALGLGAERLAKHIWGNPQGDADRRVLYGGGLGRGARELGKSISSLKPEDVKKIVYAEREREKMSSVYAAMADELVKIAQYGPFQMPVNEEIASITRGAKDEQEELDRLRTYDNIASERVRTPMTIGGTLAGGLIGGTAGHFAGGSKHSLIGMGLGAGLGALGSGLAANWIGGGLDAKNTAIREEIARRMARRQ